MVAGEGRYRSVECATRRTEANLYSTRRVSEIEILDCTTFKLDDWEPEKQEEEPNSIFCYIIATDGKLVCRWREGA
jgi:hypothetical protein